MWNPFKKSPPPDVLDRVRDAVGISASISGFLDGISADISAELAELQKLRSPVSEMTEREEQLLKALTITRELSGAIMNIITRKTW